MKYKLKLFCILLIFGLTVFGSGYIYLNSRLNETTVSENVSSVPYYSVPENACVLMQICQDDILLYLDFEQETLNVIFAENTAESYGYTVDYISSCDYETVGYLVDFVGGIELESYRYTGTQVTQMLEYTNVSSDLKRTITKEIISGISQIGFTKEALLYLIENSETNLKFNECFLWVDYIKELCEFPRFVN